MWVDQALLQAYHHLTHLDQPARLIIRLLFEFASHSVLVNSNYKRNQLMWVDQALLQGHHHLTHHIHLLGSPDVNQDQYYSVYEQSATIMTHRVSITLKSNI